LPAAPRRRRAAAHCNKIIKKESENLKNWKIFKFLNLKKLKIKIKIGQNTLENTQKILQKKFFLTFFLKINVEIFCGKKNIVKTLLKL
jgi:hypothetical protein